MEDESYKKLVKERMTMRIDFLQTFNQEHPEFPLPDEAIHAFDQIVQSL